MLPLPEPTHPPFCRARSHRVIGLANVLGDPSRHRDANAAHHRAFVLRWPFASWRRKPAIPGPSDPSPPARLRRVRPPFPHFLLPHFPSSSKEEAFPAAPVLLNTCKVVVLDVDGSRPENARPVPATPPGELEVYPSFPLSRLENLGDVEGDHRFQAPSSPSFVYSSLHFASGVCVGADIEGKSWVPWRRRVCSSRGTFGASRLDSLSLTRCDRQMILNSRPRSYSAAVLSQYKLTPPQIQMNWL